MGALRKAVIFVLLFSIIVFCALFGQLPRLRNTPIGFINRLIWKKIPGLILGLDRLATGGRSVRTLRRAGIYLMNENHPLILFLYLSLLIACHVAFIPPVHAVLPWSYALPIYPLALLPYYFTYMSVTSTKSFISPASLPAQMREYPYDRVLYRPAQVCRTCRLPKPARSKHCGICKRCVHRMDHHCVWVRNCLGRHNYAHFLAMLLSLAVMLAYGAYLAFHLLDATIQDMTDATHMDTLPLGGGVEGLVPGPRWSKGLAWSEWLNRWTWVFAAYVRVGAIGLLAAMTAPLAAGLLGYHIYLIWRGMTTNESFKWEEWAEDVQDGHVYRCIDPTHPRPEPGFYEDGVAQRNNETSAIEAIELEANGTGNSRPSPSAVGLTRKVLARYSLEDIEPRIPWPIQPQQRMVSRANKMSLDAELLPATVLGAEPWVRVEGLDEVINIYDLGFWRNLKDALNYTS